MRALILLLAILCALAIAGCDDDSCPSSCSCGDVTIVNQGGDDRVELGSSYHQTFPMGGECLDCAAECQEACGDCTAIVCFNHRDEPDVCEYLNQ